jgi:hypothetical protein
MRAASRRLLVALTLTTAALAGVSMLHSRSQAEAARRDTTVEGATVMTPSARPHRVIAYYFHTTARCASCRAIEANSREALESAFANEIKDGRLLWKVVNVDIKGNEHFVKDYGLYTKSVVLVNEVRGKPAEWKNLEKVWQLLQDKPRFIRYVQDATRSYLTERS